jgi:hypothetical protein
MSALLNDLSRAWVGVDASGVLDRWHRAEPSLRCHPTLEALTDAARGERSADFDERDGVQRSLLRLAVDDPDARLAMLHVLAPGLMQVTRTYAHRWGWGETEAMVVTGALERIVAFGDRAGVRPAPNIVLGVRHDLFKRRLREDTRDRVLGHQVALDDQLPVVDRRAAGEELLGLVGEGVRSGAITRRGARLIVLHRIYGLSTAAVAEAEGRDAASVRKYRNRAEAALADVAEAVA